MAKIGRPQKEYAYYARNDKFIMIGTKKELAEELGIKVSTLEHYVTPAYRRRTKNGIRVIAIDDDDDE